MAEDPSLSLRGTARENAAMTGEFPWLSNYPQDVDYAAHFTPAPVAALLDRTVAEFGDRPATYFFGKTLCYSELGGLVDRAARGLQEMGVGPGVHVGLFLPNSPVFPIFYYGVLKAGGTVVNYNPLYSIEELEFQVKDSQTDLMITLDLAALFSKVERLLASGHLKQAVVCPFAALLPGTKSFLFKLFKRAELANWKGSSQRQKITPYASLMNNSGAPAPVNIDLDDAIAVLQYTGGTTGTPKGAMLTHANLSINTQQIIAWAPGLETGTERMMAILPFFHVFAMTAVMNFAVVKAAQMILMPRFDLDEAMKLIRRTRPTIMAGVPTLFNAMRNYPKLREGDLASLRFCISGGAPLALEIKRGFEKLSGSILVEGYGLSETSPVATCNPLHGPIKEGSIGLPLPGTRISIRSLEDPNIETPLGEKGEICIAGPQVMKGYWRRPEETAESFVGEYFRTGDIGYMDEDGFTFIVDRLKDIIICSGFNVYPRRIEEAIYEHPAVEEVSVIGIPDSYRGEAPKAFVKLREASQLDKQELLEFLESKLSKIEMPAEIEFRDELPKTLVGKLSKKELRREAAENDRSR